MFFQTKFGAHMSHPVPEYDPDRGRVSIESRSSLGRVTILIWVAYNYKGSPRPHPCQIWCPYTESFLCYEFNSSEFRVKLQTDRQTDRKRLLRAYCAYAQVGSMKHDVSILQFLGYLNLLEKHSVLNIASDHTFEMNYGPVFNLVLSQKEKGTNGHQLQSNMQTVWFSIFDSPGTFTGLHL